MEYDREQAAAYKIYRKTSNISRTKSQYINVFRLVMQLSLHIEAMCSVENVSGAAPTGDAPITSEWSTILLPTKVRLISDVWW